MSVSNGSSQGIGFDIKDFIELLQKSQNSQNRRRASVESDKLSIILSASEPESSMGDKENYQISANKTNLTSYSSDQAQCLFRQLKTMSLNIQVEDLVSKLEVIFNDMKKTITQQNSKLKMIENQYEEEKKGTDEMLKALIKMDEAQKELWSNYNELLINNKDLQNKVEDLQEENENLRIDLSKKWEDIEFMRKLVLVANQNYQSLDRKYKQLLNDNRNSFRFKEQRSSPEISSRSARTKKKSSLSPGVSERSNLSARKNQFQENYRRLVLRTLKSKAIR